jgi:hypothetical protein
MTLKTLLAACCLAAIAFSTAPAGAGELRAITSKKETSSSRCIGDPKTPLCAVETAMACELWGEQELCNAVDYIDPFGRKEIRKPTPEQRQKTWLYNVIGEQTMTVDDALQFLGIEEYSVDNIWVSGDTAILIWGWRCDLDMRCIDDSLNDVRNRDIRAYCPVDECVRVSLPMAYLVRKKGDSWKFILKTVGQGFPLEFWNRR